MPQPKSSSSRKRPASGGAKRTAAKPKAAKRTAAKRTTAKPKSTASRRKAPAKSSARSSSLPAGATSVEAIRELITRQIVRPLEIVMITRERVQEAFDDAVHRGRLTRSDAEDLVSDLYQRGRQQTEDVLADIEQLLGRARPTDNVLRQVDRARRVAGVGPNFPIIGYDSLSVSQINARLEDLSPAELRKVRDHERRGAKRKSVLNAIERKLS